MNKLDYFKMVLVTKAGKKSKVIVYREKKTVLIMRVREL